MGDERVSTLKSALSLCVGVVALAVTSQTATAILLTFDGFDPTANAQVVSDNPNSSSGFSTVREGDLIGLNLGTFQGINVTVFRENLTPFDLIDNELLSQQGKTGTDNEDQFGTVSLDPFFDTSPAPWVFTFSEPIRSFSTLIADFGGDKDGALIKGYDGPNASGNVVIEQFFDVALPRIQPLRDWTEARVGIIDDSLDEDGGFMSVEVYAGDYFLGLQTADAFINTSTYLDRIFFAKGPDEVPPFIDNPETLGDDELIVPEPTTLALLGLSALALARRRRA